MSTVLAVTLLIPFATWAEHIAEGVLRSVAYHPMPANRAIRVTLFDDTDENLEIKRQVEEELQRTGYSIDRDSSLELAIDTEIIEQRDPGRGPTLGRAGGSSEEGYDFQLNLWSSTQDSVFGGRKPESEKSESKFHLNAVLRDHSTGRFLWQGDAYAVLHQAESARLARFMVAPLVEGLGRSVASQKFPIY